MTRYEVAEPVEVVDRLLWRDAQMLLNRHAELGPDGRCIWCGWRWPCPPRRLGERAEVASRRPWRSSTVRHDVPGWRAEIDLQATVGPTVGPLAYASHPR